MFRTSIGPDIPQVVALLGDSVSSVRQATALAFEKFSEQVEFQEPIRSAIHQIVAFLNNAVDVRQAGVNSLAMLSEHDKSARGFRVSNSQYSRVPTINRACHLRDRHPPEQQGQGRSSNGCRVIGEAIRARRVPRVHQACLSLLS
ncbi:hypothetical protein GALMADRAFT_259654 [Galerina marginata CBS 339.88]|uniref:Uncharacterized protein n=1 Tax=Galerina marginata (strain CBS 339.88) TaxID=685588 RepID=A0A067S5R6_GALM3|nr:hypothetical protein GALMADRAFT_259654 [Galerina marginata CBS 339.88]